LAVDPEALHEIGSIDDLYAYALAVERETASEYMALARAMDATANVEVATLFRRLAEDQRRHAATVEEQWRERGGKPEPASSEPENESEAAASGKGVRPHTQTVQNALARAMDDAEKTFGLYTAVASNANDEAVQTLAETFAKERLNRLTVLRAARIKAFRDAGGETPETWLEDKSAKLAIPQQWAERKAEIEAGLTAAYSAAVEALEASGRLDLAARVRPLIAEGSLPEPASDPSRDHETIKTVRRALIMTEAAFDHLLKIAQTTTSEDIMLEVQSEAEAHVGCVRVLSEVMNHFTTRKPEAGGR
jgi:rubrerythrin